DNLCHATRADQLIELQVGYRANQGEALSVLPDDFIARSERNERFQSASHRDGHAVLDVIGNRVMKRAHFVHVRHLYLLTPWRSTAKKIASDVWLRGLVQSALSPVATAATSAQLDCSVALGIKRPIRWATRLP